MIRALALTLLLSGCMLPLRSDERVVSTAQVEPYTRADVDAINAEIQCRTLARTLVQSERCGVRR